MYGKECTATLLNRQDGIIHCSYVPRNVIPHTIEINYGDVAAAQSPYRVYVKQPPDLSKLIVSGNWFETDVTLREPVNFTVDASRCVDDTGTATEPLEVHVIHDSSKTEIPVKVINNNNVYTVEVTPLRAGKYVTKLIYGGAIVPLDKLVFVSSNIDVSKITVQDVKTSESLNFSQLAYESVCDAKPFGRLYFNANYIILYTCQYVYVMSC